jgi:hypothetical protein
MLNLGINATQEEEMCEGEKSVGKMNQHSGVTLQS